MGRSLSLLGLSFLALSTMGRELTGLSPWQSRRCLMILLVSPTVCLAAPRGPCSGEEQLGRGRGHQERGDTLPRK